ncbi:MAG TPA: glycosyltransferase family 39 protein, partial [Patescibacteria group bacterium]
ILLFYILKQLIAPFTLFINFANNLNPGHGDVMQLWHTLLPINKATALFSAFFIPLLSTISLVPLYFSAKTLYGTRVAQRSIFLFFFIPTIVFFIPINDAFLHLFSITAFFFLLKGLEKNQKISFFLSGVFLLLGIFFNLSLLPILLLLFIFALLFLRYKKAALLNNYLTAGIFFSLGVFLPLFFLNLFFHFNLIQVMHTITTHAPGNLGRSYPLWLYFNIQDFLIFCGIPIALIFLLMIKKFFLQIIKNQLTAIDPLFVAFFMMIIVINFSGFVLGETGRLWSPYIPFMVLITVSFVTSKLKFSNKLFVGILILQIIQLLVMQEFWVMLW